jgi:hypothetical protein
MPFPFRGGRNVDVDEAVNKLKTVYGKYAGKHGSRLFNLAAFEERYKNALRDKRDLGTFLHAEIAAFEELKKRVEGDVEAEPHRIRYADIADGIIEKNLQRVRKYRSIDFHPDAEIETKHLLGACTDFYDKIWRRAARVLRSLRVTDLGEALGKLENDFIYFVVPSRGSYSRAVDDYLLVLARRNARDGEKAAVNFIRFGGILLNNCLKAMTDGINVLEGPERGSNLLSGPREELLRCRDILLRLVEDFRLGDIRGY